MDLMNTLIAALRDELAHTSARDVAARVGLSPKTIWRLGWDIPARMKRETLEKLQAAYAQPPALPPPPARATERRCPRCGLIGVVLAADGTPLPRAQRAFDLIKSDRYRGGYRWRSLCRACHNAERLALRRPEAG